MNPPSLLVRAATATAADLDALAPLFDAYRQFYEQAPDLALARRYLGARLARGEALLWGAWQGDEAVGLCQCYPSFCSVIVQPILVLYDLYVSPAARGRGAAQALMQAAEDTALARGCARLDLTTAHTNTRAQALYESRGWALDTVFRSYNKTVGPQPREHHEP